MLQAQQASPSLRGRLAVSYHELGRVAQDEGRLGEAAEWYARSLAIRAELDDLPMMAFSYHQLGVVAQLRGQFGEAADWYARFLAIEEELGDLPMLVVGYHQLGMVAQLRGRLDEAADWYAQSLTVEEELGDLPKIALSCCQLGLLAEAQRRPSQALEWAVRCAALFDDVPHLSAGVDPGQLARLARQLGNEALEACWRQVTGDSLPPTVRDYVRFYDPNISHTPE
jgi:tetratricopeptide (TPR) repeat protein